MAELIALVITLSVISTAIVGTIFWLLWITLGKRMPFLVGFVCLVIGLGPFILAAASNWFSFGLLALGFIPFAVLVGPAVLGIVFVIKGTRASLRKSRPAISDAVELIRKDWLDKK